MDCSDLKRLRAPHPTHPHSVTVSPLTCIASQVISTCSHHQKAVYGFVWCSAYSMFASCGLERDVILWQVCVCVFLNLLHSITSHSMHVCHCALPQGNTCRRIGELTGHNASVTHVALDNHLNHVFTLSLDKVIKVGG